MDFAMVNTLACDWETVPYIKNISSRFSSNSEANASELLENLEEMFLRYR